MLSTVVFPHLGVTRMCRVREFGSTTACWYMMCLLTRTQREAPALEVAACGKRRKRHCKCLRQRFLVFWLSLCITVPYCDKNYEPLFTTETKALEYPLRNGYTKDGSYSTSMEHTDHAQLCRGVSLDTHKYIHFYLKVSILLVCDHELIRMLVCQSLTVCSVCRVVLVDLSEHNRLRCPCTEDCDWDTLVLCCMHCAYCIQHCQSNTPKRMRMIRPKNMTAGRTSINIHILTRNGVYTQKNCRAENLREVLIVSGR